MTAVPMDALRFASRVEQLRGSPIGELDTLLAGRPDVIPLAGGTPHRDDIPRTQIMRLLDAAIEDEPELLSYGLTEGDDVLRAVLMRFSEETGDGAVAPEQLIVTTGAMQALDLIAKLFVDPGDLVLVESPTFTDSLATLSAYEASVVEVPMDEEGIVVEEIPAIVERAGRPPKLIYVIPTFQNPTGITMTPARRESLVEMSRRYRAVLVDDDPYRLLRYRGEQLASLRSAADPADPVIAVRSASKLIAPGLRVGWALGPAGIVTRMVTAKQGSDVCTSNSAQRVVAGFLASGLLEQQLARANKAYARRLAVTAAALEREFAGTDVRWLIPDGGYFIWITLPADESAAELLRLAIDEGVSFVPGPAFSPAGGFGSSLRLCFVPAIEDQLAEGVRRLRVAYERLRKENA